jgi:hypothetical protein
MKSWKTTLGGAITAIGAAFSQSDDATLKAIGQVLIVLGPVLIGIFAKDSNVHGGTVAQDTPATAQVELKEKVQQ